LALSLGVYAQGEPAVAPHEVIVDFVQSEFTKAGGDTVVVFPFPYSDGISSVEGALLAERVQTALTEGGVVRVVERELLDNILAEQKLSASGLIDAATRVQIGKLLGATGIVSGTVTDLGEKIEVHARLIRVETGENVASKTVEARKTIKTFISPLWEEIERIKREGESFGIKLAIVNSDDPTAVPGFQIGEYIELRVAVEKDCYVTVFDFATSGSIHVLFPNSFQRDNKLIAEREYNIPGKQAGYKIRVKGPPGIERLKVFATTQDIPLFAEDYSQESFRSITPESFSTTRDLQAVVDSLDKNAWAETHLELRIEPATRGSETQKP
jgi:TolB-like protein